MSSLVRKPWSPHELDLLRAQYPVASAQEIADALGRGIKSVYLQAFQLGLRKPKDWIAERARLRMSDPHHRGRTSQFKPGLTPHNKGKKQPKGYAPGRMAETQFKPGHRPHTWHPIGHERITDEGYLQRKVTDTGNTLRDYVNLHWLVWQAAHGEVPKGYALVFKNGARSDIRLDNLELVSRAELMRRNSYHTRYPKEIGLLIQARGALHRVINRRSREKQDSASA